LEAWYLKGEGMERPVVNLVLSMSFCLPPQMDKEKPPSVQGEMFALLEEIKSNIINSGQKHCSRRAGLDFWHHLSITLCMSSAVPWGRHLPLSLSETPLLT
jgi:hypothetical protein